MTLFELTRLIHILSAGVLFGGGAVIAFFMMLGWRSGDLATFRVTARHTVIADWVFTATAVVVQPVSGLGLVYLAGYDLSEFWIMATLVLYVFIGVCWLPVVWIQMRVKRLLEAADGAIPDAAHRLMRTWFILGWPAFAALVGIFGLMISRPV